MDSDSGRLEVGCELTAPAPVGDLNLPSACGESATQRKDVTLSAAPVDTGGNEKQPWRHSGVPLTGSDGYVSRRTTLGDHRCMPVDRVGSLLLRGTDGGLAPRRYENGRVLF
jgi:hypothetical protein